MLMHFLAEHATVAKQSSSENVVAAGKIMQHLPFRGSSLVVEPPRDEAKQQLQDCLERVVSQGCSHLVHPPPTQAAADSQQDYFFDLKLVSGQTSCMCHRSAAELLIAVFCPTICHHFSFTWRREQTFVPYHSLR